MSKLVQLVLTDRSQLTAGREFGVMSPLVRRLADLGARHAFAHAGLGWGSMPRHMVQQDPADGSLVQLRLKAHPLPGTAFSMRGLAERAAATTCGKMVCRSVEMRFQ
ncbi:hypothetical protein [Massilia sp.]|uniref:hypothetical protein n=1 Tax=Massilia sp. TaxID=1882437 RepID=UPI00391BC028